MVGTCIGVHTHRRMHLIAGSNSSINAFLRRSSARSGQSRITPKAVITLKFIHQPGDAGAPFVRRRLGLAVRRHGSGVAMTRKVWVRCLLVSLLASVAAPLIMIVPLAPDAGTEVPEFRGIDPDKMNSLSERGKVEYLQTIPTHRVQGIERFTWLLSNPWWVEAYWRGIVTWFVLFLASTVLVSFLNARDRR